VAESGYTSSSLAYDAAGRVRAISSPGSASDVRSYASSGFLSARTVTANSGIVLSDTLAYDLRGLMISARTAYRRGQSSALTAVAAYTGLGALAISANDMLTDGQAENFKVDAIGNRLRISRPGFKPSDNSDFLGVRFMSYDLYARLTQVVDSVTAPPDNYDLVESYQYDNAGTQTLQYIKEWNASSGTLYDATKSYPSIDDKLSVVNRQIGISAVSDESHAGHHAVYQENWYDALGRRVLVRAQKSSACNNATFGDVACKSFVERTVWDGDQVLLERRADGASGLTSGQLDQETSTGEDWGEVISLHALGLDAPIAVRKTGRTTLAPHENWQGAYEIGTTADGTPTSLCTGATTCPVIQWPGGVENADGFNTDNSALSTWWGSLITEKLDASGLKYMRNRYYNPGTGQFTQQDPIGLAGGLNLYGFAGGNPVNFSDPFGLCPDPIKPWCSSPLYSILRFFGASDVTADKWAGIGYGGAAIAGAPGTGMAIRGVAGAAAANARMAAVETNFGPKISSQLGKRGWTKESVNSTIAGAERRASATDTRYLPDGTRMNDAATAYINADGSYVVRNNRTGDIVQLSNRNDPSWRSPFQDK
jgi:RHS repeat-associated protein